MYAYLCVCVCVYVLFVYVINRHIPFIFSSVFYFSQINVNSVDDLDVIHEELLGVPLLLRVWAEHTVPNPEYSGPAIKWEGQYWAEEYLSSQGVGINNLIALSAQ